MMVGGPTLYDYYKMEFQMKYFLKYSRSEIEEMYPWERDILTGFFNQQKQEEKEEAEKQQKDLESKMPKIPSYNPSSYRY